MHFRIFIASSHREAHKLIREHELEYDHKQDQVFSTGGGGAKHQMTGLVPKPEQIYLLPGWQDGVYADEYEEELKYRLFRVRKTLEDCQHIS